MSEAEILTLKQTASEKTGVPVNLISGETAEEIAASAAALAAYKRDSYENAPTRDKFAAWINGSTPAEVVPEPVPAAPAYPIVPDGGEPQNVSSGPRDPRDAFTEWFADISAFDPRKTYGNF